MRVYSNDILKMQGEYHLKLVNALRAGHLHLAVGHHAGRQASCAEIRLYLALLERGQLHKRVRLAQQKVSPGERQRLDDARAGVPQRGEQHLAAQIWHEWSRALTSGASRYFGRSSTSAAG